jgi:hypothetical protein
MSLPSLAELLERQRQLSEALVAIGQESSPEEITQLAVRLQRDGLALDEMARAFEAREMERAGPAPHGALEVALTSEQRQRVRDSTGVDLDRLILEDPTGTLSQAMPLSDPRRIELAALAEAKRRVVAAEAAEAARTQVEALLRDILDHASPNARDLLDTLRADSNWLAGLLRRPPP